MKKAVGCKVLLFKKIMTLLNESTLANFVPAAAVIREELVLLKIIWRKTYVEHYCHVKI